MSEKLELDAIHMKLNKHLPDGVIWIHANLKMINALKGRRLLIPKEYDEEKKSS